MNPAEPDAGFDELLDRFEQAWRQGVPAIDDFLKLIHVSRRELLVELVKIDLGHRWRLSKPLADGTCPGWKIMCSDFLTWGRSFNCRSI